MFRLILGACLAVTVGSSAVVGQTTLRHEFPDGRKTTTTVKIMLQQALTLNGQKHEVSSEQEMVITAENGIRDKEGELRQRLRVDSLKAKLVMPGAVVLEFDSSNPNPNRPRTKFDMFLDLIEISANASWTVVRDKDNRVKSIDGRDRMLESLDQTKREMKKKQFDADFLREQANREMLRIPSQPLNRGDSWELAEAMRLEAGQNLNFKHRFTYQGEVEREGKLVHRIDMETIEAVYSIDRDAPTPLKVISSKLQPRMIEGVIYFDAEQGQVVESRESVEIIGDLNFQLDGNDLAGQINLTMGTASIVEPSPIIE